MTWAFAKLELSDWPLLEVLSSATVAVLPKLTPQELGNIAWAFATQLYADGTVLRAVARRAQQYLEADSFQAQGLSNLS